MFYRKYFILILFVCAFCKTGYSQEFLGGIRGGFTATQVAGDGLSGFNKLGVHGGGFVSLPVSGKSWLQMEIDFIQKGSKQPYNKETGTLYTMRLAYVEVPVLFRYRVTKDFIAEAGPSVGTLVFSEEEDEYGVEKYNKPFNKYELSLQFGLDYRLSAKWSIDSRFSTSIIPIRDFTEDYHSRYFDKPQYNTVLAFAVQYTFNGK